MKRIYWILSIVFIVCGVCCICCRDYFKEYEIVVTILGSLASLFGIVIAIIQACQAKSAADVAAQASKDTRIAVKEGMEHVKRVISLVDIAQILHIPNEVQDSIQQKEWLRAYEKLRYLKDFMVEIQNTPIVINDQNLKKEIISSTQELEVRINAFSSAIQSKKDPYAYKRTGELMERIRTLLKTLSTTIKYNSTI